MVHAALVLSVKVKCLLKVPYSVCRHGDGRTKLNYWFKDSFFTLRVFLLNMLVLLVSLEPGHSCHISNINNFNVRQIQTK